MLAGIDSQRSSQGMSHDNLPAVGMQAPPQHPDWPPMAPCNLAHQPLQAFTTNCQPPPATTVPPRKSPPTHIVNSSYAPNPGQPSTHTATPPHQAQQVYTAAAPPICPTKQTPMPPPIAHQLQQPVSSPAINSAPQPARSNWYPQIPEPTRLAAACPSSQVSQCGEFDSCLHVAHATVCHVISWHQPTSY